MIVIHWSWPGAHDYRWKSASVVDFLSIYGWRLSKLVAAILIYANEYKKGWECFRSVCNLMCMIIRCTVRNLEASCSVKFCAIAVQTFHIQQIDNCRAIHSNRPPSLIMHDGLIYLVQLDLSSSNSPYCIFSSSKWPFFSLIYSKIVKISGSHI